MSLANAIRGQRVVAGIRAGGFILRGQRQQLVRAEDNDVDLWTVVLAPVTESSKGASIEGQPSRDPFGFPGLGGAWACEMTWGGGGVTFRTRFTYPVNGATFGVAGQNIMIDVFPQSFLGGYTPENVPAVEGWVMPSSSPTSLQPLVQTEQADPVNDQPIDPWCRALNVSVDDVTASVRVEMKIGVATSVVTLPAGFGLVRIPITTNAEAYRVIASAGVAYVGQELVFT